MAATLAGMESSVRAIFDEKKDRLREVERRIPEQRDEVAAAEAALASVTEALNETGEERARAGARGVRATSDHAPVAAPVRARPPA